jgi:hypothetical protein
MTTKTHEVYTQLTAKALTETQKKIKVLYDYELISGSGIKFYVNIETRQVVPIVAGKVITRITEFPDEKGCHIVYAQNQKILVPESDIIGIGLN